MQSHKKNYSVMPLTFQLVCKQWCTLLVAIHKMHRANTVFILTNAFCLVTRGIHGDWEGRYSKCWGFSQKDKLGTDTVFSFIYALDFVIVKKKH